MWVWGCCYVYPSFLLISSSLFYLPSPLSQAFNHCCKETGFLMLLKCREENSALKECLTLQWVFYSFYRNTPHQATKVASLVIMSDALSHQHFLHGFTHSLPPLLALLTAAHQVWVVSKPCNHYESASHTSIAWLHWICKMNTIFFSISYKDPVFFEECKQEYIQEKLEFERTGIPAKNRKQKLPTSM